MSVNIMTLNVVSVTLCCWTFSNYHKQVKGV